MRKDKAARAEYMRVYRERRKPSVNPRGEAQQEVRPVLDREGVVSSPTTSASFVAHGPMAGNGLSKADQASGKYRR